MKNKKLKRRLRSVEARLAALESAEAAAMAEPEQPAPTEERKVDYTMPPRVTVTIPGHEAPVELPSYHVSEPGELWPADDWPQVGQYL